MSPTQRTMLTSVLVCAECFLVAADGSRKLNEARSSARVFGFFPVTNGESLKGSKLRIYPLNNWGQDNQKEIRLINGIENCLMAGRD